ncbi:YetF domain-containing protein [Methanosarcina sp. UBA5]|uniref:YetF domain-containing protein n=1 Tax=Methanosarcina sp. UBA5 TaxID=1915593 RepID=UPI0025EC2DD6|nr:YetF domain-containing protein [Methanosarcina sp. UBA5]
MVSFWNFKHYGIYRVQNALANSYLWYEDLTEGSPVKIITDGILDSEELKKHTPTQDDLFLLLRNKGVRSLGEVEAAYLERDGSLSVFKYRTGKQKSGLPTISEDMIKEWKPHKAGTKIKSSGFHSCYRTGETAWLEKGDIFRNAKVISGYCLKRHKLPKSLHLNLLL